MNVNSKVFVAGHNGMVGSSIVRKLKSIGLKRLIHLASFADLPTFYQTP